MNKFHGYSSTESLDDTNEPRSLHDAVRRGAADALRRLLRCGADPHELSLALIRAVWYSHEACIRLLLAAGADVNATAHDRTVLMNTKKVKFLPLLLEAGVDVNARDSRGATALLRKAQHNRVAWLEPLLKAGADINARDYFGSSALHLAAYARKFEAVQELIRLGADVNAQDAHGNTPLMAAISSRSLPIARLFLAAGADTSLRDCGGRTADDDAKRIWCGAKWH